MIQTVGVCRPACTSNRIYWRTFMNMSFVYVHEDCQVVHSNFN